MRRLFLAGLLVLCAAATAAAQSLNVNSPAPLQPGVNQSQTDNFTGTHYWYFYGGPGAVTVHCQFTAGTVLGAQTNSQLTFTIEDAAMTWHTSKTLNGSGPHSLTLDGTLKKRTKLILAVAPISGGLVRMGGAYSITVSGAVAYGSAKAGDPIVGTYTQMAGMTSNIGLTKFKADGTVVAASGDSGTWKLFDAGTHAYVIVIAGQRLSVILKPGVGLVDSASPDIIEFKATQ
jgi:hypothetical protein